MNTKKDVLIITHNDGSTVEVEPCKPAWPCHYEKPCSCDEEVEMDTQHDVDVKKNKAEILGNTVEKSVGGVKMEMTPEEVRIEHIKAVYYARKVILQYGTPSEKIATNRAMKKMEIKLGIRKAKNGKRRRR